jgi:hypothetical protein
VLPSPANKHARPDREQYLARRLQSLNSPVHLVEIDLLRGGPRLPLEGLTECDSGVARQSEKVTDNLYIIIMFCIFHAFRAFRG